MPAVYSAQTGLRQHPPAPKAPEPEPIRVRHASTTQLTKTKAALAERDERMKALLEEGRNMSEIARLLGYSNASGVTKRLQKMGLLQKGYRGRPR